MVSRFCRPSRCFLERGRAAECNKIYGRPFSAELANLSFFTGTALAGMVPVRQPVRAALVVAMLSATLRVAQAGAVVQHCVEEEEASCLCTYPCCYTLLFVLLSLFCFYLGRLSNFVCPARAPAACAPVEHRPSHEEDRPYSPTEEVTQPVATTARHPESEEGREPPAVRHRVRRTEAVTEELPPPAAPATPGSTSASSSSAAAPPAGVELGNDPYLDSVITFGKYKGQKVRVALSDKYYLKWLRGNQEPQCEGMERLLHFVHSLK